MRWLRRLLAAGTAVLGGTSCSFDTAFACDDDQQCAVRPGGTCAVSGWCAYPSDPCPSGRAYGPHAPKSFAGNCVLPDDEGTGGDSGSEESGDSPVAACGNGVLEEGESCDDGNTKAGDGCHPLCVEPYQVVWTAAYEGERGDRGFAVDVDTVNDAIYVVGLTETTATSKDDLLVQRYSLRDGERAWSWSRNGEAGIDTAEHVQVDANGDIVVAGVETDDQGEHAWLARFDAAGEILWEQHDPTGSKAEGVAITGDGRIAVTGRAGPLGESQAWIQRYAPDGAAVGDPVLLGLAGARSDVGADVIAVPGVGIQVTGSRYEDTPNLWTARFDDANEMLWQDLVPDPEGDWPRGVGQALSPLGGTIMVGTRNTDRFAQFYDDLGVPQGDSWQEGQPGQDEVADVAFLADGRYVLVGFIGFNLSETGTADGWIRFNEADGTLIEEFPISGTGGGVDKMLAVENAPGSIIVTGYVANENTNADLWLRRYAI